MCVRARVSCVCNVSVSVPVSARVLPHVRVRVQERERERERERSFERVYWQRYSSVCMDGQVDILIAKHGITPTWVCAQFKW